MATTAAYAPGFLKPYSKGDYNHLLRVTTFFFFSLSPFAEPIVKSAESLCVPWDVLNNFPTTSTFQN